MSFVLTQSVKEIERNINQALLKEINRKLPNYLDDIKDEIKQAIPAILKDSKAYKEIVNGNLGAELGIPSGEEVSRLDDIIQILQNEVEVNFNRMTYTGNGITGGVELYIFNEDFKDILSRSSAIIKDQTGYTLPWLQWLIVEGDRIIVTNHSVRFGPSRASRSNKAVMVTDQGGFWRVPPEFSGTLDDNWITRAILDNVALISSEFSTILEKYLTRALA